MHRLFKADYREKADVLSSNRLISDGARSQHLAVMRHSKKKMNFSPAPHHLTLISSIDLQETLMNLDALCTKQMRFLK